MKQSLFSISILLFGLITLGACSKDNEPVKPTETQTESPYPTGAASFDANGYAFVATEARARYSSNGNWLGIELKNDDGKTLVLRIPEFAGVETYTASNYYLSANYTYLFNSKYVYWTGTENNLIEITAFDESEGTLSGNFSLELKYGYNTLFIEDGVLENIPIVELLEPAPGNADFFLKNTYYRSDSPYAVITNNFQLVVYAPYNQAGRTLALKSYIGIGEKILYPTPGLNLNSGPFSTFIYTLEEEFLNVDIQNQKLTYSARSMQSAAQSEFDFEIKIKDIPILSLPLEVDSGMTKLVIGTTEYEFPESAYYKSADGVGSSTYYFEATNAAGNKLIIDFTYYYGSNFNRYAATPGYGVFLNFYENGNDLMPTIRVAGMFGDFQVSENQTAWVGFESDTVKMRGVKIPFFE